MAQAYHDDNKANSSGKPALNKLMSLDQVCRELKKLSIQEIFIDKKGCTLLGHWLEPLPDKTYPNILIVQEILNTVNALPIEPEDLQNSPNLKHIVKLYSTGETGM
jgi:transcription factor SPN1